MGGLDDRGARLRTRRRPLAVRGLRLRPPGARLPRDRRALLPRHRVAQGEGTTGPRAARLGPRLGRLQRRPARLRQGHPPGPALLVRRRGPPRRAPRPRRRPDHGLRAAGQGRGGSADRGFGRYRGSLVARNAGGTLQVINALGIQGYVKGVVASEVPSSWPAQALRAQAVVARSYGLATARGGAFDHYADTRSQVYGAAPRRRRRPTGPSLRRRTGSSPIAASRRSPTTSRPPAGEPRARSSAFRRGRGSPTCGP